MLPRKRGMRCPLVNRHCQALPDEAGPASSRPACYSMPTILGFLVAKRNSCIQQLGDIRRDRARVVLSSLAAERHPGTSFIDALIGSPARRKAKPARSAVLPLS